ncbi:hypothetical protein DPMN_081120 [Dreissena polymorpha]|uniref:Uncharacterized protein n=1 Tax=Dreissena polymorpha TaxID=45954 RepID=A0A9D3Y5G3_DREPO|nr:hypothetical protein DPMN_081120 [Dreissena polymorpha]
MGLIPDATIQTPDQLAHARSLVRSYAVRYKTHCFVVSADRIARDETARKRSVDSSYSGRTWYKIRFCMMRVI